MGLCSHNGLLVMLLFHLCQAQEDALPSPDPEPAPPSLGEVIDAVKAAFEQAVQISTNGAVREALEQVVGEFNPQKNPADQSPALENTADHTTEAAAAEEEAVVLSSEEPAVLISESSEQTYKEQSPEGLTRDIEPAEVIQGLRADEESSISDPEQKSDVKPEELVLEVIDSVQEQVESVLQDSEITEVSEPMIEDSTSEESPVQTHTDIQNESRNGAVEMNKREKEVEGEPVQGFTEEETQLEERTAKVKIEETEVTIGGEINVKEPQKEEESVEMQEGNIETELSQEDRQAVTAQMGTDGSVLDMDEVEQEEEEQEAAEKEEGVIEVEAKKDDVEAGSEAQLQKVSKKEEDPASDKTEPEKTQQEPEVVVETKGPIKFEEPVITKTKETSGERNEESDVNEIINSRDPDMNVEDEPVLNTVVDLPPTPVLRLRLGNADAPVDEQEPKVVGQEAWKIGAIAAAFFLLLQTAVTVVYILKCRRKPDSVGVGNRKCDANNTDTAIPIDEESTVDDLPEYSQVQQEDVAMTTIPLDSGEKNPSCDPRTSVV